MNILGANRSHERTRMDVWRVAIATGVRWIGWGMAEPLFPVFLFLAFRDYGWSSAVDAAGGLAFLFVLPVAGRLADRISMRRFLIAGIILFFFDGLWAIASLTGMVVFALIANLFDGIAVASDVVGRATFVRRQSLGTSLGFILGVQNGIVNLGFVLGGLISLFAAPHWSLTWIFFGIVPTNLIALWLIWKIKGGGLHEVHRSSTDKSLESYRQMWVNALRDVVELRWAGLLLFYCSALTGLATLLIPIYAYSHGADLREIVILGIIGVAPDVFGSFLGGLADRYQKKLLPFGLCFVGLSIASVALVGRGALLIAVVLAFRVALVVIGLVAEIEVTKSVSSGRFGQVSAAVEGIKDIGKLAGAVALGFSMDQLGERVVFVTLGVATCILGASLTEPHIRVRLPDQTEAVPLLRRKIRK